MDYELIRPVIVSQTVEELAVSLRKFLDTIKTETNKRKRIYNLYNSIARYLMLEDMEISTKDYYIVDSNKAVLYFLLNYWNFEDKALSDIKTLEQMIQRVETTMPPAESPVLSKEKLINLLDLTETKLQFISKVLHKEPLKILCLNNTHKDWNCYYSAAVIPGEKVMRECIMMTCIHDNFKCDQEFGVLHELGHVLHTRLTKQLFRAPSSFNEFQNAILNKGTDFSSDFLSEMYADFFAIAMLHNTQWSRFDLHHNLFSDNERELMFDYMKSQIDLLGEQNKVPA